MLTGHQLHKVANVKLEEYGFDTIPPQMVYNYIKQGRIKIVDANGQPLEYSKKADGQKYFVTVDEGRRWVKEFLGSKRNGSNGMAELLAQFEDITDEDEVDALDNDNDGLTEENDELVS